tara:strand:+ start:125 stop:604 length:480 start_codon:yes stop_codon:yes gene_type:complete
MVIEYINQHHGEFWIAVGFALLAIEVLFLGMATGVLLFAGLGTLATGLMMLAGILPETWLAGCASVGISSGIITILLWQPLKRMQGDRAPSRDKSSDLIGLEFVLTQDIQVLAPGKTRYSGVDWRVEIAAETGVEEIAAGQRVSVVSVDAGVFRVKPLV